MPTWNPWHGCHKLSSGCQNCYVYRIDQKHNRDSSVVVKNQDFNLPIKRNKKGEYKIPEGETVYTCFSSDFFVEEADEWRKEAWNIIKQRMDLDFLIITKRIDRFWISLPDDWENGYENVSIYVTCENQDRADYRSGGQNVSAVGNSDQKPGLFQQIMQINGLLQWLLRGTQENGRCTCGEEEDFSLNDLKSRIDFFSFPRLL